MANTNNYEHGNIEEQDEDFEIRLRIMAKCFLFLPVLAFVVTYCVQCRENKISELEKDISEIGVVAMESAFIDTTACTHITGETARLTKKLTKGSRGYNWGVHEENIFITPSAWIYDDGRPTEYTFLLSYKGKEYSHRLFPFTIPLGYQIGFVPIPYHKPHFKANALGDFYEIKKDRDCFEVCVTYRISETDVDNLRKKDISELHILHPTTPDHRNKYTFLLEYEDCKQLLQAFESLYVKVNGCSPEE